MSNKVYLWKKNGAIVKHMDLAEGKRLDGLGAAELSPTLEQWKSAGEQAYINAQGEITLGKDPAIAQAEALAAHQAVIDKQLDELDAKKTRPVAAIAKALAAGETPNADDVARLNQLENQSIALRNQRNSPVA